ncbi:glucose transporter [Periweissella fabaria]|uniref:Glucose uptake protein GlcU n=1 Tax=Periweissella fabaria TaxID=546157 RepID=A0ABM8Z7L0_9LACO|nr:GRP family sugar transporter [Periweissella fabaria]MCM0597885.1 glucose transporter [Periweissella fabaria]CAH0417336.1 Glucose uptake protein GlcU [Periweissella fabaria]
MFILIALIPALAWGSTGLFSTKLGGSAGQQTLGMTFGAMVFGLLTYLCFVLPNHINMASNIWVVGLLSGLLWAVGQAGQFTAIKAMGVSNAIPWSNAGQIVSNAALAATILGEWQTGKAWLFGSLAVLLVVIGAILTAKRDAAIAAGDTAKSTETTRGIVALVISTIGYAGYFIVPNMMRKFGYISNAVANRNHGVDYLTATIFPQSIGMVVGAFIIVLFFMRESKIMFQAPTWRNILTGGVWGIGNLAMFISTATIGQAVAVTIAQMGIIVGTFGGIFILKERKTSTQMKFIIAGSILIVIGGILISNLPK